MRLIQFKQGDYVSLAARRGDDLIDLKKAIPGISTDITALLGADALDDIAGKLDGAGADCLVEGDFDYLPPLGTPSGAGVKFEQVPSGAWPVRSSRKTIPAAQTSTGLPYVSPKRSSGARCQRLTMCAV